MIEVGMGEQDEIETLQVEGQRSQILLPRVAPALEHATVDQEADVLGFNQEARPGYFSGRAPKCNPLDAGLSARHGGMIIDLRQARADGFRC